MRVLVCRAYADGVETARALAHAGHEAVLAPVLDIAPLPGLLPPRWPDAVVATSRHAVERLTTADTNRFQACPTFAVGASTAGALRGAGFRDVRVAQGDAAALLTLVRLTRAPPAHLLYLAGRPRKPELEAGLARAGYGIEAVELYESRRAAPWDETVARALRAGSVGACLHYSARSARLVIEFADQAGCRETLAAVAHVCLSDAVATVVQPFAKRDPLVAAAPSEARLVQALAVIR